MVDVAQLVEHRVVAAGVESSNLSVHPKGYRIAAIAPVSKTGERKLRVGSSPTAPAKTTEKKEEKKWRVGLLSQDFGIRELKQILVLLQLQYIMKPICH